MNADHVDFERLLSECILATGHARFRFLCSPENTMPSPNSAADYRDYVLRRGWEPGRGEPAPIGPAPDGMVHASRSGEIRPGRARDGYRPGAVTIAGAGSVLASEHRCRNRTCPVARMHSERSRSKSSRSASFMGSP